MDTVDPDTGSGERQGFESSFAGSVQCIMGLTKCKQIAVKTSNMAATWVFKTVKLLQKNHKVAAIAEATMAVKVVIKEKVSVRIVEPITHLKDVLPLGRSVTTVVKTTTTKPFADLIEDPTVDEMEGEDLTMKLNKMMKAKTNGHFH